MNRGQGKKEGGGGAGKRSRAEGNRYIVRAGEQNGYSPVKDGTREVTWGIIVGLTENSTQIWTTKKSLGDTCGGGEDGAQMLWGALIPKNLGGTKLKKDCSGWYKTNSLIVRVKSSIEGERFWGKKGAIKK